MSAPAAPPPAELELVLLCARGVWNRDCDRRLSELAARAEWPRLMQEAVWHGLSPLVHRRLRDCDPLPCPPEVFDELHARSVGIAMRNAHLWKQLSRLSQRLEEAGTPAIALKGMVLARTVWGELGLRPSCDLDLLVLPEHLEPVIQTVQALGFEPSEEMVPGWLPEHIRTEQELQLWHDSTQTGLDLHWRLHPAGYRITPLNEELWRRAAVVEFDGQRFKTLGSADNLMFLAMHAAKHEWGAARWLVDIAELLRRDDVDWQTLDRRSGEWSMRRMWRTTLQICVEWLQLPVPQWVADGVRSDAGALRLAAEVGRRWRLPAPTEIPGTPLPWRKLFFQALDSRADRARMLFDFWAKPGAQDWRFCALPRALWPLYAAVRPLRAFTHQGGAAVKKYLGRQDSA